MVQIEIPVIDSPKNQDFQRLDLVDARVVESIRIWCENIAVIVSGYPRLELIINLNAPKMSAYMYLDKSSGAPVYTVNYPRSYFERYGTVKALAILSALVAHEISHKTEGTPLSGEEFKEYLPRSHLPAQLFHALINCVEDERIERLSSEKLIGLAAEYELCNRTLRLDSPVKPEFKLSEFFNAFLMLCGKPYKIVGNPHKKILDLLAPLAPRIRETLIWRDTFELALEVAQIIRTNFPREVNRFTPPEPPKGDGGVPLPDDAGDKEDIIEDFFPVPPEDGDEDGDADGKDKKDEKDEKGADEDEDEDGDNLTPEPEPNPEGDEDGDGGDPDSDTNEDESEDGDEDADSDGDSDGDGGDSEGDEDSDADGDGDCDGDADGDGEGDEDSDSEGDEDGDGGDSNADEDGDEDGDCDGDCDSDSEGDEGEDEGDSDSDGDGGDSEGDEDSDADGDGEGDEDGKGDSDSDSDADADGDEDADSEGDGDCDGDCDSDEDGDTKDGETDSESEDGGADTDGGNPDSEGNADSANEDAEGDHEELLESDEDAERAKELEEQMKKAAEKRLNDIYARVHPNIELINAARAQVNRLRENYTPKKNY